MPLMAKIMEKAMKIIILTAEEVLTPLKE